MYVFHLEDVPKPTVALEYCFGRRPNQNNSAKDIVHVWELAGGLKLCDLLPISITSDRLPAFSIIITVDLSNPGDVLNSTLQWIKHANTVIEENCDKLRRTNPEKVWIHAC
jgi:dynein light intermediate chain 2